MFMEESVDDIFREKVDNRLVFLILGLVYYLPISLHFFAANFLIALFLIVLNKNKAHMKMIYSQ